MIHLSLPFVLSLRQAAVLSLYFVWLGFTACEQAPKSTQAKTEEAKKVEAPKTSDAGKWTLDLSASSVGWVGTKPVGKHNGTFALREGSIALQNGEVTGGTFLIDIASLKVLDLPKDDKNNAKLVNHLLSKDFFDVEKYATAKFEITGVAPYKAPEKAEKTDPEYTLANPTHTVSGNLTLKGVVKNISFPARISLKDNTLQAEAKFNINREDWGMSYGAKKSLGDQFIRPTVHLSFRILARP